MTGFSYHHPTTEDGLLTLDVEAGKGSLRCVWPLDQSTDEWFEFNADFREDAYRQAIEALMGSGIGELAADLGKRIVVSARSGSPTVDLEMISGYGVSTRTLLLRGVAQMSAL